MLIFNLKQKERYRGRETREEGRREGWGKDESTRESLCLSRENMHFFL